MVEAPRLEAKGKLGSEKLEIGVKSCFVRQILIV